MVVVSVFSAVMLTSHPCSGFGSPSAAALHPGRARPGPGSALLPLAGLSLVIAGLDPWLSLGYIPGYRWLSLGYGWVSDDCVCIQGSGLRLLEHYLLSSPEVGVRATPISKLAPRFLPPPQPQGPAAAGGGSEPGGWKQFSQPLNQNSLQGGILTR